MDSTHTRRILLRLILAGFAILATIYSVVTPIFEASDELWHYPMVKYVADHNFGLPVQRAGLSDADAPWRQEGSQPPLYYMLGAALTFWIDTDDMPQVRRLNPHADIGVIVPDGNANMVLHNSDRESFPWSGTVLAMRLVRFLSILMGLGTVVATYLLGRELFPNTPMIGLGAAAFTAFNPMFLFISAVINNDNLSTLMASILLLLIVRVLNRSDPPTPRTYLWLGLAAGVGMLAKFQIGWLLALVAFALLIVAIRRREWRVVVVGGAISGGITILIAGWWYWRNYDLYGDFTGINIFLDIVGRRAVPADLRQLWTERKTFMMSYWGLFGGVNVPMWDEVYTLVNVLAGFAFLGLLVAAVRSTRSGRTSDTPGGESGGVHPSAPTDWGIRSARILAAIWPIIVFFSLIIWTRQTPASQGRLMFSAIAPISIGLAAGCAAWSPTSARGRVIPLGVVALIFVTIATITPFTIIRPAYILDPDAAWSEDTLETDDLIAACFREPETHDREALCIVANRLDGAIQPGAYLLLDPVITVKNQPAHNWSIFVHLINEDGIIEAQRDVYPGGGLVATAEITPGKTWRNPIAVKLPPGLYTPQTLSVYLGFYDYYTKARMIPAGENTETGANRVLLGQIRLETPEGDMPNPVNVNFANQMTLLGYEITDRSLRPGESTDVTLYWEARRASLDAYAISFQIIDPDPAKLTKAAQNDNYPAPPTDAWVPGIPVTETRTLTIYPDAAPGRYRLMIRVYPSQNGIAGPPLRIRASDGGQSEDFVWLSWIQVEAAD